MQCALVDDDPLFNEEVIEELGGRFPSLQVEVIKTEKEFRERLDDPAKFNFDFVILDVMVHWADQSEESLPDPALKGGYFRAGIRCLEEILKRPELAKVPVIIHSALDEDQILAKVREQKLAEDHLAIISKRSDLANFCEAVQKQMPTA
jgi:DNA-binding NarL/FixJ family response regulator